VRRLPIRLRLTLAFAAVMALVLAATGLFVYFRLDSTLREATDDSLRSRAADVSALVRRSESGLGASSGGLVEREESFTQVVGDDGRVVDAAPSTLDRPLLTPAELARARAGSLFVDRPASEELDDPARLLATPVETGGERLVVVVGSAVDDRDEALASVAALLLIGGPIALVLASLAGYGLAAAALRPVEAMRRRAAAISARSPGQRLPVPAGEDEVARLGATLNAMLGRLEEALARERRFVSDAGHELRTPLALLKSELELALRQPRTHEELERALRSAAEETDRLAQLAEDLLLIARSDDGKLPVRLSRISVEDVLEGIVDRFARRATDSGRRLEADSPPGLRVVADPLRLQQALGNLVENALRYGNGTVRLAAGERDGRVELHVTDEGEGFAAAFLPRAFERFSRADAARSRGGTGLGLAIVEAIASAHGGTAHAANAPGGGADVWISLPNGDGASARP
jgi:two-component system OmpR family sensor kinase